MNADFQTALRLLAKHEGGWSDRDKDADPGGKTMYGITQDTYNDWCDQKGKPHGEVRHIAYAEAAAIYRAIRSAMKTCRPASATRCSTSQ